MKKMLAILISLLLIGIFPTASAEMGITEEAIGAQAFAIGLACRMNDYDDRGPDDLMLWDAAGWYAAQRQRAEGIDLLTDEELWEFMRSIEYTGPFSLPETWEDYGIVRPLRSSDGVIQYDFAFHKEALAEMLGITTEVHTSVIRPDLAITTITSHYENGSLAKWAYRLCFEKNIAEPSSRFPFRLSGIETIRFEPQMEGSLNFTWKNLLDANSLSYILRFCPAVCVYEQGSTYGKSWYFLHNGEAVLIREDGSGLSGQYGRYAFDCETAEDGARRVRIGSIAEAGLSDSSIQDYFAYLVNLRLDRIEGDLFRLNCTTINGETERIAVNRGTLMLEEITYDYVNYPSTTVCFDYTRGAPDYPFLKSWDGSLRTVTVIRENYEAGEPVIQSEFLRLPADWEYLPYEGRWGDYTIYMDDEYTKPYVYPGDGVDYTLYLTTATG